MRLTELEKTILVAFYVLSDRSTRKYVTKEALLKKFPMRQRKAVRKYIEEVEKKKLIVKHETEEKYMLNKKAIKEIATALLLEGVRIRV